MTVFALKYDYNNKKICKNIYFYIIIKSVESLKLFWYEEVAGRLIGLTNC